MLYIGCAFVCFLIMQNLLCFTHNVVNKSVVDVSKLYITAYIVFHMSNVYSHGIPWLKNLQYILFRC
jgi:hypothetical protein